MIAVVAYAIATLCGVYLITAIVRSTAFARTHPVTAELPRPPVTVIKPLAGADAQLFENLCSFCEQDYPRYQIVFAVRDDVDPAIPIVLRVLERYPAVDLSLVIHGRVRAANPKIANVMNAAAFIK